MWEHKYRQEKLWTFYWVSSPQVKTMDSVWISSCENTARDPPESSQRASGCAGDVSITLERQKWKKHKYFRMRKRCRTRRRQGRDVKRAFVDKSRHLCQFAVIQILQQNEYVTLCLLHPPSPEPSGHFCLFVHATEQRTSCHVHVWKTTPEKGWTYVCEHSPEYTSGKL